MTDLEKFEELFKSVGVGYTRAEYNGYPYLTVGESYHESGTDFDFNLDGSFKGVDVV